MAKKVLFACIENAGRSQMANALFNASADPAQATAISAGTQPGPHVHPAVQDIMLELGIDLSGAQPTKLTQELAETVDILVTMGCGEKCPFVPGLRVINWDIENPKNKPVDEVRAIREIINGHVMQLIKDEGWNKVIVPETTIVCSSKFVCTRHDDGPSRLADHTCGASQFCLPGMRDLEGECVYCELPSEAQTGNVAGVFFEDDDAIVCKITHEGRNSGCTKPCNAKACKGDEANDKQSVLAQLSWLDKLLPVWIIGAMVLGVLLGYYIPSVREHLQVVDIAGVSLPVAVGLWMMMLPVLTKVDYQLLSFSLLRKSALTSFVLNWVVGPFLMCGLAWACLPDLPTFRNGVIMVGLARCIAMVLIWNQLAAGDPELCAVLVAFNALLQMVLYAPLSIFFLNVISGTDDASFQWWPVARSVLIFLGIPLVGAVVLRYGLIVALGKNWLNNWFLPKFGPIALLALVYTIIVMFAVQGEKIVDEVGNVARVAVPMVIYFATMFSGSLIISWKLGVNYAASVTQAFTASSNNFELAIAVAVATFGVSSDEALAATVGPLIEVPALLGLVYVALWMKQRWEVRAAA